MFELDIIKSELSLELLRGLCDMSNSRIAGFILYTRKHANIVKILKDDDYWCSLDEISGPNWPIFAVRPLESRYCSLRGSSIPGTISMMVPTYHEPNANRKVLKYFGLEESADLPCFIVFMWDDNNQLCQIDWKIDDYSVDSAYNSIKEVVELISKAEQEILPEYKMSTSVFRQVKSEIEGTKFRKGLLRICKGCENGISLMGSVASLVK